MRYKSRISYLLEFLHTYLVLLAIMTIPIALQTYTSNLILMAKTLFILAAIIILFFAERYCRSIFSFLLIGIPLLIIPYLIQTNGIDFFYQFAAVIILIITYAMCRLGSSIPWVQEPNIYYEGVFLVIYFLGIYLENSFLKNCMVYYAMGYLLIMLLYTNLTNMGTFLKLNREVANLPAGQIKSVNRIILLILLIVTIAAMLLLPISGLGNVITGIGLFLFNLLKWIIRLFRSDDGEPVESVGLQEQPENKLFDLQRENASNSSWLLEFFTTIAFFAATVLILAAIIYGIYYVICHFYRPATDGDEKLFLKKSSINETQIFLSKSTKGKFEKIGKDPNGTIRRIYKKAIKKRTTQAPPSSFTPTQLEHFSKFPDTEDSKKLHQLYEQARYSQVGVTKEDVVAAKNLHIS